MTLRNSDNTTRSEGPAFRQVGSGLHLPRLCWDCATPRDQAGGKRLTHGRWVCAACHRVRLARIVAKLAAQAQPQAGLPAAARPDPAGAAPDAGTGTTTATAPQAQEPAHA